MSESAFVICDNCEKQWDPDEQDYTSYLLRCPDCGYRYTKQYIRGVSARESKKYLYIIEGEKGTFKIGISANPKKRMDDLQTGNSSKLKLRAVGEPTEPEKIEKTLHEKYEQANVRGEWFNLCESDISFIIEFADLWTEDDEDPEVRIP